MKRAMFFAALMCCLVSASAQPFKHEHKRPQSLKERVAQVEKLNRYANTFSETLDSIYGDFQKCQFEYDNRFNCVKIENYWFDGEWILDYTEELAYDEQDRIVTRTETSVDYTQKSDFTYNELGWLSEELAFELMDNVWEPVGKYIYEYDSEGHMVLSVGYEYAGEWLPGSKMTWEYEDGRLVNDIYYFHGETDWVPLTRNDYTYNAEGLCHEELQSRWEGAWTESYKVEYEYNEAGFCILSTTSAHYDLDEWVYTYQTQYNYDANGNVIASGDYYYYETDWELESTMTYTYDLAVTVDATAGIWMVWEDDLPIHNKVLSCQMRAYGDEWTSTFYYSDCVGLDDNHTVSLAFWPNPASEMVHVEGAEAAEVQVYNTLGQLVKTIQGSNEINVSGLAEGVYLLRITDADGKNHVSKVVVR